ncbi:MAG: cohesin domain-containing protein, partial [Bacteroidota bacterium]
MKKIIALLVLGWALHTSLIAQPTITISNASPEIGEEVCLDITVKDFTDILSMEFTIAWDSTVLQFDRVDNFDLSGLSAANFDQTMTDSGVLPLSWLFNTCESGLPGLTIDDDTRIFSVCFTTIGAYGAYSDVRITNSPTDILVTRFNACNNNNNIGLFAEDGYVSTEVRPLTLIASEATGNQGELVTVDFSVLGFDDLTSMQFSVNWDPSIIQFEDLIVLENLTNLAESNFATPGGGQTSPGNMTLSWSFVDIVNNTGVSLNDSTLIFQVNFRVVGDCETSSAIQFSGSPTSIEVTNTIQAGFNITVQQDDGSVQVGDCDPTGLQLFADCGTPKNINDEVCVEVTAGALEDITDLEFLLEWNDNILDFKEVRNISNRLFGFNSAFDVSNVVNGVLGVDWEGPFGLSGDLSDGDKLFDACFDVVGLGGNSPIRFGGSPARVRVNNGPNIGIAPNNCEIVVNQQHQNMHQIVYL